MFPWRSKTLLVGIGAQRSGTTWLGEYLAGHPQVFMSPVKELHHFDARLLPDLVPAADAQAREIVDRLSRHPVLPPRYQEQLAAWRARVDMIGDDAAYGRYFLEHAGRRKVMCEITPAYSMLDRDGFARIAGTLPRVRFAFLMRNPIDRVWSQIRYAGTAVADTQDFRALLDDPQYDLRTDYRRTLTELFAAVPRRAVFAEFFETLFSDGAIRRLCAFLRVKFLPGRYATAANAGRQQAMPADFRAVAYRKFAHVFTYVNDLFGGDIPHAWKLDMIEFAR